VSSDESGFVGLKLLFRIHVVRVLLHLVGLCLLAEVDALLKVVLHHVHLCYYPLNANQLIRHFAAQPPGSDKIGAQVALKTDLVVLHFPIEARSLVSELVSLEVIFGDAIILLRVFDEILGSLGVLLPKLIDVDLDGVLFCDGHPDDEVVKEPFVVLHLHFGALLINYEYKCISGFSVASKPHCPKP